MTRPDPTLLIGRGAQHLTGLATDIDQLRTTVEALAAKVRRHEEELRSRRHHGAS